MIFYTRNNPNPIDPRTKLVTNTIKPAFYDKLNENEKGSPYWMSHISDGVRQYTIKIPDEFEILELINRKIFKFRTKLNHGRTIRDELSGAWGENPL